MYALKLLGYRLATLKVIIELSIIGRTSKSVTLLSSTIDLGQVTSCTIKFNI